MTTKKLGMNRAGAEELQLFFGGMLLDSRVDRQPGQECADNSRQVDEIGQQPQHRHNSQHGDEERGFMSRNLAKITAPKRLITIRMNRAGFAGGWFH